MRLSSTHMQARKMLFAAIPSICALSSNKISIYFELALSFLRLILQAKGLYLTEGDSWLRAFPHFEETLLSVSEDRGSVASTPVEGEGGTSFEERVLLEPAGARFVVLLSQWAALPHGGGRLRPNLCRSKFGSRRTYKKKESCIRWFGSSSAIFASRVDLNRVSTQKNVIPYTPKLLTILSQAWKLGG